MSKLDIIHFLMEVYLHLYSAFGSPLPRKQDANTMQPLQSLMFIMTWLAKPRQTSTGQMALY